MLRKGHVEELKRVLIVDDSEIDRTVLRGILEYKFEVYEADNGYSALDMIAEARKPFDAILLDIAMPVLDGLSVLRMIRAEMEDIPVFMITSEATKDNIQKAIQYHVEDFIRKPFSKDVVLQRVGDRLGVDLKDTHREKDIIQTRKYMADLTDLYEQYLIMEGKDKRCDEARSYLMSVLLKQLPYERQLDSFRLEMLRQVAYLCNIGNIFLPDITGNIEQENSALLQQHTLLGAKLVQLNYSDSCKEFVKLCSDVCLHHHERYDGGGFPNGVGGSSLSDYAQICGLLEEFDKLFYPRPRHDETQFGHVLESIEKDVGLVCDRVLLMFVKSKTEIINYYNS